MSIRAVRLSLPVLLLMLTACAPTSPPSAAPTAAAPSTSAQPTAAAAASPAAPKPAAGAPSPSPVASPSASPVAASKPEALPPVSGAPQTVRLGLLSSASDSGLYIAMEKGYFREQGISVETSAFDAAAVMVAPLAAGQLDVGGGAPGAGLANALARGLTMKIVADKATPSVPGGLGYQGLMIRKALWDSGEVRGPEGLKGRKVALPNTSGISPEVLLQRCLEKAGFSTKDVELVQIAFPDMLAAFASGSIDASIELEPLVTAAIDRNLAVRWPGTDTAYPDQQVAVLIYSQKFMETSPDLARRFMIAYLRGVRDYNDAFVKKDPAKRQEVIGILTKNTPLEDPALYEKVSMPGLDPNGRINKDALKFDQNYFIQIGKQQVPVNIDELVDTSFADFAVQQLGTYR